MGRRGMTQVQQSQQCQQALRRSERVLFGEGVDVRQALWIGIFGMALAGTGLGCGHDSNDTSHAHSDAAAVDAAGVDASPATDSGADGPVDITCGNDARAEKYSSGMTKIGKAGLFSFGLTSVTPSSPTKGANTWQVTLTSSGTAPVNDASFVITPFMPDHGHGTPVKAKATLEGNGKYSVAPVQFTMPGIWEVTLEATSPAGKDTAVFTFCVPG